MCSCRLHAHNKLAQQAFWDRGPSTQASLCSSPLLPGSRWPLSWARVRASSSGLGGGGWLYSAPGACQGWGKRQVHLQKKRARIRVCTSQGRAPFLHSQHLHPLLPVAKLARYAVCSYSSSLKKFYCKTVFSWKPVDGALEFTVLVAYVLTQGGHPTWLSQRKLQLLFLSWVLKGFELLELKGDGSLKFPSIHASVWRLPWFQSCKQWCNEAPTSVNFHQHKMEFHHYMHSCTGAAIFNSGCAHPVRAPDGCAHPGLGAGCIH